MNNQTEIDKTKASKRAGTDYATNLDLSSVSSSVVGSSVNQKGGDLEGLRYSVQSELGRGGMGTVFRVYDKDLQREVAFKTMHDNPADDFRTRFIRESRITGKLQHPNIVPLHDIGSDQQGNLYLSMQLIEGKTLETLIEELRHGGPEIHEQYSIHRRLEIFLKIASALEFSHAKGVIHRDLKPANIMLGPYDEVFVMDWGLACYFDIPTHGEAETLTPDTQEGTVMGTVKYMPPEQASGLINTLGPSTDIYSLCAILYEFLTLEHYLGLGENSNRLDYISAIMSKTPDSPDKFRAPYQARVSRWLAQTINKGLKKDPSTRFQKIEELSLEIRQYLSGNRDAICTHTTVQRVLLSLVSALDDHPFMAVITFLIGMLITIAGVACLIGVMLGFI